MRDALLTLGLALAIAASFVVQEFIPPMPFAEGARVSLVPVFFCVGACLLPFWSMTVLALVGGFLTDFTQLQIVQASIAPDNVETMRSFVGAVELSPGWSILVFVAFGLICQGLRPLVLRGQWWFPPLCAAALTVIHLALQFGMITMRRFDVGGLYWSDVVTWRILAPGALALVLALFLVLIFEALSHLSGGRRHFRDY